jgi:hypothetical protein
MKVAFIHKTLSLNTLLVKNITNKPIIRPSNTPPIVKLYNKKYLKNIPTIVNAEVDPPL